jgi:hypothetical protein
MMPKALRPIRNSESAGIGGPTKSSIRADQNPAESIKVFNMVPLPPGFIGLCPAA